MDKDYQLLLPKVLLAMYPDDITRNNVINKLSVYGDKPYHRETDRVRMGILKLAYSKPDKLDKYIELACSDYRDLLCEAEYPLSSRNYRLPKTHPEKYQELQKEEAREYDNWLKELHIV